MKYLLTVFVFLFSVVIHGQSTEQTLSANIANSEFKAKRVIPPSPEAAELGKYGNVPVSLYSGTPNVSIPLYDLSSGDLSLPISLSYNASGFKPEEIATWVGLNWSLNAGGVITRSVIGNPDVSPYYFNSNNNYQDIFAQTDQIEKYNAMLDIKKGYKESQPDIYYYNFAGISGKFIIKPDGTVVKKEKNNLKINNCVACYANITSQALFFSIVDEKGTTYEFSEAEVSTTTYDPSLRVGVEGMILTYTYPSTFLLTKIISANGNQQITFEYYTTSANHTLFHNYLDYQTLTYINSEEPQAMIIPGSDPSCPSYYCSRGNTSSTQLNTGISPEVSVQRKYLKRINFINNSILINKIDFESSINQRVDLDHSYYPEERLLNALKVYKVTPEATETLIKQYNFQYSYFSGGDLAIFKRLRLDQVQEIATAPSTANRPPYIFSYNNSLIPPVNTAGKDHWGFYNGANNYFNGVGYSLIPTVSPGYGIGADRNANFEGSFTAALTKITYPTGGSSTFEYELNTGNDGSMVVNVGGLRVKKIVDYSFITQKAIQKEYNYILENGSASGITSMPSYTSQSNFINYSAPVMLSCNPASCSISANWNAYYYTITASPNFGLGAYQGSHIGYNRVVEMQTEVNSGIPLGKTVYVYKVGRGGASDDDISSGDLLQKSIYDKEDKLIHEVTNTYNYPGSPGWIAAIVTSNTVQRNKKILCKYDNYGTIAFKWLGDWEYTTGCLQIQRINDNLNIQGYSFNGKEKQLVQQTEKKLDQLSNAYIVSTKNYSYGNTLHTYPTHIEETTSSGEIVGRVHKYAADYIMPAGVTLDNASQGIKLLQDKNIPGAEIETAQYRQNSDGTNKRFINGNIFTYNPGLLKPTGVYRIEAVSPLSTFQLSNINSTGSFVTDPFYKLTGTFNYSGYGNLQEQIKANDYIKSYIWDENYLLPVAEVANAKASSIAYTSFETSNSNGNWEIGNFTQTKVVQGGIMGKLSYNLITGDNIIRRNLPSSQPYIVSYWSKNGSLSVISNAGSSSLITGVTKQGWTYYEHLLLQGTTLVTVSATNAIIDELRLYPANAQMSTTASDPFIGIIASCSPANQINYYEYDALNRLINIKDIDGNIVKNIKYNYGPGSALTPSPSTLFYNTAVQLNFTKNDGCPAGTIPTTITYKVPYGKHVSAISQIIADAKAQDDINNNGQTYANINGQCLYYNVVATRAFFKNDCTPSQGTGSRVIYTVPAAKYNSITSQTDADGKAQAEINSNGQAYANSTGTCSCGAEGQKIVNGICETGTRFNASTVQQANGQWQCTYYYQFSDLSVSGNYYNYSSSPCQIQ